MNNDLLFDASKESPVKVIFLHLLFIALIFIGGSIGLMIPFVNSNISPMWPPSGIGLAILLCFGLRYLPAIALGSLCINTIPVFGHQTLPWPAAIGVMFGSTLSIWIAYYFFQKFKISRDLSCLRDILLFVFLAVLSATLIAALLGIFSLAVYHVIPTTDLGMGILIWWMGDAVGILLLTPFFLSWRHFPKWSFPQWIEFLLALGISIFVAEFTFQLTNHIAVEKYPLDYIIIPIIFWVAVRFHQRGISLLSLIICGIGIYATINGKGLFQIGTIHESLFVLQSYIFVICGSGLFLTAIERERENSILRQKEMTLLHQKTAQMLPGMIFQFRRSTDGAISFPFSSEGIQQIYETTPLHVQKDATPVIQRLHPDDYDRVMNSVQISAENLTLWHCEYRVNLPQAGVRWLSGKSIPERLVDGSTLWHGFITDITDQKQKEELLKISDEQNRSSMENAAIGMVLVNPEGLLMTVNRAFCDLLGYEENEILGEKFSTFTHPEDLQKSITLVESLLNGEKNKFSIEKRYQHKNGSVIWCQTHVTLVRDQDQNPIHFICQIQDISQQIKIEKDLKIVLERLHLATSSAEIGIWDYDVIHDQLWWDNRMYTLYGLAPSDQNNYETWSHALHPEDREKAEADLKSALQENKSFNTEFRIIRPDGLIRFIKAHALVQQDLHGNSIRILGVNWDQTSIKMGEEQLIEGKNAAEAADRSKSEFLAMMSHEIRTPMNGVIGFARLLKGTPLSEEQTEYVETIEASGQVLMDLLNDILDLSKIESGKIFLEKHPAEIEHIVQGVCTLFKPKATEKALEMELYIDSMLPPILWIDPTRLKQIIQNLLSNAIKFTSHGKISVSVHVLTLPIPTTGGITLQIDVHDTGIGIAEEVLPRLFNPFMQADSSISRRFGGTGLGLVIVKRLCELMGGTVRVQSELGQGSTFTCIVNAELSLEEDLIFSK